MRFVCIAGYFVSFSFKEARGDIAKKMMTAGAGKEKRGREAQDKMVR